MSKWIQITKDRFDLDNETEIRIKGDVKSWQLFKGTYRYTVELYGRGHSVTLAENVEAGSFRNSNDTFSVNIEKRKSEIVKCASPTGQSCYLKVTGVSDISKDTVEYFSYFTLIAPSMAMPQKFSIGIEAVNDNAALGEVAVIGFSKLKATISGIQLTHGARITRITFGGSIFEDVIFSEGDANAEKTEQTVEMKDVLKTSGVVKISCTVINSFGYSATAETSFRIMDYKAPSINFIKGPYRVDTAKKQELQKGQAKKNKTYGLFFDAEITPYPIKTNRGANINKIIPYDEKNKVYVEIENPKDKTWSYLTSASVTNAVINNNGTLTTGYSSAYAEKDSDKWPKLEGDEKTEYGLAINRAYILKFTVIDITGTQHVFKKRIPSITTTVHLKRGGGGISFGGYATKENTVESEYQILCNELIEAVADDSVTDSSSGKGVVRGKFLEAGKSFKLNNTEVEGFGTGEKHIAIGNHTHGDILADGKTEEANKVLISNGNKDIEAADKLPFANLQMENEKSQMKADGTITPTDSSCPSLEALLEQFETNPISMDDCDITLNDFTPGDSSSGLCYANHRHPYSREWSRDPLLVKILQNILVALSGYL